MPPPQAYCRQVCRDSHSNFVKTFYFMPPHRRRGFEAVYAFCRLVDDAVDEATSPDEAGTALSQWRQEVSDVYQGTAKHPVGQALEPVVRRFQIPREHFDAIMDGCEADILPKQYQTFAELKDYCYRVASCVGLIALHLFEAELDEQTQSAAIDLGIAVQLTNILRDIASDLKLDRVYLPLEDLTRFGLTSRELIPHNGSSQKIGQLLHYEIGRAKNYYHDAWAAFPKGGKEARPLMAAAMMGRIYEGILEKIEKDPLQIYQERIGLSRWKKLSIMTRTLTRSL